MATPQTEPQDSDTSGEGCLRENTCTIVVVGEAGAGKSALINGLLGPKAVKKATTGFSARGIGKSVEEFRLKKENVDVKIFDTPGLFGSFSSADIFREIADKTEGKIDLLVYCHNMQTRITEKDVTAIGIIADVLCKQNTDSVPWENVLYVLTFANMVESHMMEEIEDQGIPQDRVEQETEISFLVRENFEVLHHDMCERMHKLTQQINLEERALSNGIPVVPAGFRKAAIPGYDDWLDNLWSVAFSRVRAAGTPASINAASLDGLPAMNLQSQQSASEHNSYKGLKIFSIGLIICATAVALLGAYMYGGSSDFRFWEGGGITGGDVCSIPKKASS